MEVISALKVLGNLLCGSEDILEHISAPQSIVMNNCISPVMKSSFLGVEMRGKILTVGCQVLANCAAIESLATDMDVPLLCDLYY